MKSQDCGILIFACIGDKGFKTLPYARDFQTGMLIFLSPGGSRATGLRYIRFDVELSSCSRVDNMLLFLLPGGSRVTGLRYRRFEVE